MKKQAALLCILAVLLVLTSTVSADDRESPETFRIIGRTRLVDLSGGVPYVTSMGLVRGDIRGLFSMGETIIPVPPEFLSSGTLKIRNWRKGKLSISFEGSSDGETVSGTFQVTDGTGSFEDLEGALGVYDGIADQCIPPCDPFGDPECVRFRPKCSGFWVDFEFDSASEAEDDEDDD